MAVVEKALIIIAVSKYKGAYANLPGTLECAKRLKAWAEPDELFRGYTVLSITDEEKPVTVDRLKTEIKAFFEEKGSLDRLVVYFAGHGLVRSSSDEYWLLSEAPNPDEGIDVEAFKRRLMKIGLGQLNDTLTAGQLVLIGDCCRDPNKDSIEFRGDPIVPNTTGDTKVVRMDRFASTELGNVSFHIRRPDDTFTCLFSDTLLEALEGGIPQAFVNEDHKYSPAVINYSLTEYLENEVPKRVKTQAGKEGKPDIVAGIFPPDNVYFKAGPAVAAPPPPKSRNISDEKVLNVNAAAEGQGLPEEHISAEDRLFELERKRQDTTNQEHEYRDAARHVFLRGIGNRIGLNVRSPYAGLLTDAGRPDFLMNYDVDVVGHPERSRIGFGKVRGYTEIHARGLFGSPIAVPWGEKWLLMPEYPNTVSISLQEDDGELSLLNGGQWSTFFKGRTGNTPPLRLSDAISLADSERVGKERNYPQAVAAGYLYEFAGDFDNILRTAHYMRLGQNVVPFDLGLLCGSNLRWGEDREGRSAAYCDLPAVGNAPGPRGTIERPDYTRTSFEAVPDVKLWGLVPMHRQGWMVLKDMDPTLIPPEIMQIAYTVQGRSSTFLTQEGMDLFAKFFRYQFTSNEPEAQHDAAYAHP